MDRVALLGRQFCWVGQLFLAKQLFWVGQLFLGRAALLGRTALLDRVALIVFSGCGVPVVPSLFFHHKLQLQITNRVRGYGIGTTTCLISVVVTTQGYAPCKTPSLQQIIFMSVEFHGHHKTVTR